MKLFGSAGDRNPREDYWVRLDATLTGPGALPVLGLRAKLDRTLVDLGKLDYELTVSLDRLRCDLTTETHDHLHGRISAIVEPEIKAAVANLAAALGKARSLLDEVISEPSQTLVRDS